MRVIFTDAFDFVTLRAKNGKPRSMIAYRPGFGEVTVKREHGEAAVKAGKAEEVKEPHKRPASSGPVPIDLIDPPE